MLVPNRFLREADLKDPGMEKARRQIEDFYVTMFRGTPHPWGSKKPSEIITHWSREWEYAWAIVNSNVQSTDKILDCGCGGSPLMPYLAHTVGCDAHGIDITYGNFFHKNPISLINTKEPLCNLKHFFVDPTQIIQKNLTIHKQSLDQIQFEDNSFDKIFCISVIEHLEKFVAVKGISEMVRVLKPGGKLFMTIDHSSHKNHVKPWCEGRFVGIIEWSGLPIAGASDFSVPDLNEVHGMYHVVGFVLTKNFN